MRIVGFRQPGLAEVEVGSLSDDGTQVTAIAPLAKFWSDAAGHLTREPAGPTLDTSAVRLVPPVLPDARVICIGLNYLKHVAEGSLRDQPLPEFPTLFARWTRSLTVDGAQVPVPANEDGLDWEGEIVAYVGAPLVDATPDEALAAVVGYSTFNDLTSRRAQKLTTQWILGKNGDNSGPLGPLAVSPSRHGPIQASHAPRSWSSDARLTRPASRRRLASAMVVTCNQPIGAGRMSSSQRLIVSGALTVS